MDRPYENEGYKEMGKTAFKTFATFTVLLLVLATAFTLIFGLCDAHGKRDR